MHTHTLKKQTVQSTCPSTSPLSHGTCRYSWTVRHSYPRICISSFCFSKPSDSFSLSSTRQISSLSLDLDMAAIAHIVHGISDRVYTFCSPFPLTDQSSLISQSVPAPMTRRVPTSISIDDLLNGSSSRMSNIRVSSTSLGLHDREPTNMKRQDSPSMTNFISESNSVTQSSQTAYRIRYDPCYELYSPVTVVNVAHSPFSSPGENIASITTPLFVKHALPALVCAARSSYQTSQGGSTAKENGSAGIGSRIKDVGLTRKRRSQEEDDGVKKRRGNVKGGDLQKTCLSSFDPLD